MMKQRLIFLIPLVLFLGLAVYFFVGLGRDTSLVESPLIDKPLPELDVPPLKEGKPGLKTAELIGEPQLINVFASWCIPCKAEHPLITQLAKKHGVKVNALNWKDKPEDALAWLEELGDPYTRIGEDQAGRAGIDLGVYGVPETYVIDAEGRIRFKHVGPLQPRHLEQDILPLLEELRQ